MRRRRLVLLLLAALVVAAIAIVLLPGSGESKVCSGESKACVFVDGSSRGGHCSDARSARAASSPRKPWCTLTRAVDAAPEGATVAVRGGSYPHLVIDGSHRSPPVTLQAYRGERVVLPEGFEINDSSGFRLRGFHVSGHSGPSSVTGSSHIAFENGEFTGAGLILRAVQDTRVSGNRIHDIRRGSPSDGFAGYGIWANGYLYGSTQGIDRLVISRNVFKNIPQDAVQLGGGTDRVSHVKIERNDFGPVRRALQADHPDPIQVLGGRSVVIRSNYFHDSEDAMIVKDGVTTGLVVSNNLMIGWPGGCIQAQFWNTPGARVTRNTIWRSACLGLRFDTDPSVGPPPSGLVVMRNVVDSYALPSDGWVARQDYNVIVKGPRLGRHDTGRRPGFTKRYEPLGLAKRLGAGSTVRAR